MSFTKWLHFFPTLDILKWLDPVHKNTHLYKQPPIQASTHKKHPPIEAPTHTSTNSHDPYIRIPI